MCRMLLGGFVNTLEDQATLGREFNLSSVAPLTYKNVVRRAA